MSNNLPEILPVEAWVQPDDAGNILFQSPYAVDLGNPGGVAVRGSWPMDPSKLSAVVNLDQKLRDGREFFDYLKVTKTDLTINLLVADARRYRDLGADGAYEASAAESFLTVYSVGGSIALREVGVNVPGEDPVERAVNAMAYEGRIRQAAESNGTPLLSCDLAKTPDGRPAGQVEATLEKVGDAVRLMASDSADRVGNAQVAADIIYVNELHAYKVARLGAALLAEWELQGMGRFTGIATMIVPGEDWDIARKLDLLGMRVEHYVVTDDAASGANESYQEYMARGGIPAEDLE